MGGPPPVVPLRGRGGEHAGDFPAVQEIWGRVAFWSPEDAIEALRLRV